MSDSSHKLKRLSLPADLAGKRVLDIGCNEGFFSNEAIKRGAAEVIGVDIDLSAIEIARGLYAAPNVHFLHRGWDELPEGPFDLVLWTSAMHYEPDPARVIRNVASALTDDGLFVLECGFFDRPHKELVLVGRHSDSRWYPTWPLLESMLSDYSVRRVADPETVEGDPVPRAVFHCRLRQPVVLMIRGDTGEGKSYLAACIMQSATKIVSLDIFVTGIALGKYHHTSLQTFIRDHYDSQNLSKIYNGIDEAGLTAEYASLLAQGIAHSDRLVVIEGLITDDQAAALTARLAHSAYVWDVGRRA
jgi:SAM-dependent methyltransferase